MFYKQIMYEGGSNYSRVKAECTIKKTRILDLATTVALYFSATLIISFYHDLNAV